MKIAENFHDPRTTKQDAPEDPGVSALMDLAGGSDGLGFGGVGGVPGLNCPQTKTVLISFTKPSLPSGVDPET